MYWAASKSRFGGSKAFGELPGNFGVFSSRTLTDLTSGVEALRKAVRKGRVRSKKLLLVTRTLKVNGKNEAAGKSRCGFGLPEVDGGGGRKERGKKGREERSLIFEQTPKKQGLSDGMKICQRSC